MYFSLPVIARFDFFGIWKYQDVGFSRFGNLRNTVAQLVRNSTAGLTATELGQILGVNAHSFMSQFRIDPRLKREKWGERLVYFCAEHDIRIAQRRERSTSQSASPLPSDAQAIIILVSLLKNPKATMEELVEIVNKEHRGINVTMVERLLEYHVLVKKFRFTHLVEEVLEVYLERLRGDGQAALQPGQPINSLKPKAMESLLRKAAGALKRNARRTFMAKTIEAYGPGGQRWAEEKLQWNRGTIRKGQQELSSGIPAVEGFSNRGRRKAEEHLPNLLTNIKAIVEPKCQTDPTFHTTRLYRPITAKVVQDILIEEYGYASLNMPHQRTISRKLDFLEYWPRKVTKSKPLKKIPETNDIF